MVDAGYPLLGGVVGENLAHYASSGSGEVNLKSALAISYTSGGVSN